MAASHRFASAHADSREASNAPELVCSYDLAGNIIESNAAVDRILGYTRDEFLHMNIRNLFGEEAWAASCQQAVAKLDGSLQKLEVTATAKHADRIRFAVARRVLFEGGRPVAIHDTWRPIVEDDCSLEEAVDKESPPQLARFAEQLRQLNRLSTTAYDSLEHAFDDHLKTGCHLLGLPVGMVLQAEGETGLIRAIRGSVNLRAGAKLPLSNTRCSTVSDRLRTLAISSSTSNNGLLPDLSIYIGTPVLVGSEIFGTLSFSSPAAALERRFGDAEKEIIELIARSTGRCILEYRTHSRHRHSAHLEKSRSRVLEMVAANHALESTLHRVLQMVETQRPGPLCSILIRRSGRLSWALAPGFPPGILRPSSLERSMPDNMALPASELAQSPVFWQDARVCPIWAERRHFLEQMRISSCLTTPILSAAGLLGVLALHYPQGREHQPADIELLQVGGRLAALAIEQRKFTERLEFRARHDSLTGLPNRAYFIELLESALADAQKRSGILAVVFIDLDRFKQINDTLGHTMGDRLLKEVGVRLRRLLTEDDFAGRMGGDEFTIVMTRQQDEQTALRAAEEFLNTFRVPHRIDGNELFVTASIGLAIFPKHGTTTADLLRNADLAMYHAKNGGKNDLEMFLAEDHALDMERLKLENALRRALENHEFELLYQPLVNMEGSVEGLEALLIWRHPIHGTISPKQFIPIAEEAGLIIEIGSWVIRQACAQGAQWLRSGHCPRLSVNVSALQFERRDFVQTVATTLALSGFPAEYLELELTESHVMRDLPQYVRRMALLRDLGVSISIDDFGTGYSSLSYLNTLPVDSLKIDQSFLRNLQEPEGSLPVVQSIVRLAHSMNLTVVAEGVETAAELDLVRVTGCDKVQGHVYGPSLRPEEAEALIKKKEPMRPLA